MPLGRDHFAAIFDNFIDFFIIPLLAVMKKAKGLDTRLERQLNGFSIGGMAPEHFGFIFLGRIFRIVK